MRLGVFGGTFDPIHIGHLILAEHCREACRLDEVLFVPAGEPPHKRGWQLTPGSVRAEMIELALAGHEPFKLSQIELQRHGPNYSALTLAELKRQRPQDDLYFIIGADSLADMPQWHEPARIVELATLVVAARPGDRWRDLDALRAKLQERTGRNVDCLCVNMPLIGISSSAIRERCRAGKSIRFMVPAAVECYIKEHGLYR